MERLPKILFALAALWSLIAGLIIFFLPTGTSVTVTMENGNIQQTISHPSWYEMQGWWGITILFIFAALYYGPLHFYNRGSRGMAALFSVAAICLTLLAAFSIGPFYIPGGTAVLVGLLLLFLSPNKLTKA